MLSKKSPRTICRIGICNNRIGAKGFSNRNCASAPSLESIFRARVSKIVFRQHRPITDLARNEPLRPETGEHAVSDPAMNEHLRWIQQLLQSKGNAVHLGVTVSKPG